MVKKSNGQTRLHLLRSIKIDTNNNNGPLHFIECINYLSTQDSGEFIIYFADDTTVLIDGNNILNNNGTAFCALKKEVT